MRTTMSTGEVTFKEFYNPYTLHCYWEGVEENDEVIAWCPIGDSFPEVTFENSPMEVEIKLVK